MIDLGQYDAIKTTPNDDDGVFVRFRQRLTLLQSKDDADYALQHLKLCRAFIIEHGISMEYLADVVEHALNKQEK